MKKAIIIGSNGYLGKHLSFYLEHAGFSNQNFDIQNQPARKVGSYQPMDITIPGEFEKLDPQVDFIFLFAGLTGTSNGFENYKDFVSINEIGLLNLLTWMRKTDCRARIVYPSTRLVYKGRKNHALKEDDAREAKTIYAANKLAAENMLWMYQNAFGIDYTVFRICVPYGNIFDEAYSYGTLGFFLDKARKGEDITLFGDGSIRRTFTHVEDICSIMIETIQLEATKNEIYNIGGENLSLLEAANKVAKKFEVDVQFVEWPDLASKLESDDTVFDDTKLWSFTGITSSRTLDEWLYGQ